MTEKETQEFKERFDEEFGSSDGHDFFESQRISQVRSFFLQEMSALLERKAGEVGKLPEEYGTVDRESVLAILTGKSQ